MFYSLIRVWGCARFPKWSPKSIYTTMARKMVQRSLPQKMSFPIVAHLGKSETVNEFVALKRVQAWSQILISSPRWLCMQNETTLIDNFTSKSMIFKTWPNISNIYHFEGFFFFLINNMESLPSNSPPIGRNHVSKVELHKKWETFLPTFNGQSGYGW